MSVTPQYLMRMLRIQLKAAPKQAVVLGGLAAVLLIVLVRMLFVLGPDITEAMPLSSPVNVLPITAEGVVAGAAQLLPKVRPQLPELRKRATRDIFSISWITDVYHSSPKPDKAGSSNLVVEDETMYDLVLELTLTGATDSRQQYAVINGTRVRVGESVSGFVVDTIAPGRVVLLDGFNERVIVQMK